jgi:hypothetical protein
VNLLTLPTVAEDTHLSVRQLRRWCATGKLRCEREGRAWVIPTTELAQVEWLGRGRSGGDGDGSGRALIGVALPRTSGRSDLASEMAGLLGVELDRVTVRELAIDGEAYMVAAWTHHPDREATHALEELASRRGGEVLEESSLPRGARR